MKNLIYFCVLLICTINAQNQIRNGEIQLYRKASNAWVALSINQRGYVSFIQNLSPKDTLGLLENTTIQKNFLRLHFFVDGLTKVVMEKAQNYQKFKAGITTFCESTNFILFTLKNILADVQKDGKSSNYAPAENGKIEITLPFFDGKNNIGIKGDMKINGQILPPDLTQEDLEFVKSACSNNPIEASLFQKIAEKGAFLAGFSVNPQFTVEEFKKLFSDEIIDQFGERIQEMKDNLDSGFDNVESIVSSIQENYLNEMNHEIHSITQLVFQEHQKIAKKNNWKTTANHATNGLIDDWTITIPKKFWNTEYKFSLIHPDPVETVNEKEL